LTAKQRLKLEELSISKYPFGEVHLDF